jgi:hypothetical protein
MLAQEPERPHLIDKPDLAHHILLPIAGRHVFNHVSIEPSALRTSGAIDESANSRPSGTQHPIGSNKATRRSSSMTRAAVSPASASSRALPAAMALETLTIVNSWTRLARRFGRCCRSGWRLAWR